jgi:hypothetical protein
MAINAPMYTGDIGNENSRQPHPDDSNLHRHLLGVHGPAASECSPHYDGGISAQRHALVQLVCHQHLQGLARRLASKLPSGKQLVRLCAAT